MEEFQLFEPAFRGNLPEGERFPTSYPGLLAFDKTVKALELMGD